MNFHYCFIFRSSLGICVSIYTAGEFAIDLAIKPKLVELECWKLRAAVRIFNSLHSLFQSYVYTYILVDSWPCLWPTTLILVSLAIGNRQHQY